MAINFHMPIDVGPLVPDKLALARTSRTAMTQTILGGDPLLGHIAATVDVPFLVLAAEGMDHEVVIPLSNVRSLVRAR